MKTVFSVMLFNRVLLVRPPKRSIKQVRFLDVIRILIVYLHYSTIVVFIVITMNITRLGSILLIFITFTFADGHKTHTLTFECVAMKCV